MAKRRYSDEERANAVAAVVANNGNVSRTAEQLDIPRVTLKQWVKGERHPEAIHMSQEKRGDMAAALEEVAWKLLDSIPDKIEAASLAQTATAMGISIDKARLLRDQPTEITKTNATVTERIADLEEAFSDEEEGEEEGGLPGDDS